MTSLFLDSEEIDHLQGLFLHYSSDSHDNNAIMTSENFSLMVKDLICLRDNTFGASEPHVFAVAKAVAENAFPNKLQREYLKHADFVLLAQRWEDIQKNPIVLQALGYRTLRVLDDSTLVRDIQVLNAARRPPSPLSDKRKRTSATDPVLLRRQSSEARWVFDDPSKPNYEVPVGDICRYEMEGWTFDDAGGSDIGTLTYTREDSSIGILGVPTTVQTHIPIRRYVSSRKKFNVVPPSLQSPSWMGFGATFSSEDPASAPTLPPQAQELSVDETLRREGLQRHECGTDGNCFFRVLSYYCYGDPQYYFEIRKRTAKALFDHWNILSPFAGSMEVDAMIERTLTDGAYIVGEVELRAACVAMDCILDVRSDLGQNGNHRIENSPEMFGIDTPSRKFIVVHSGLATSDGHDSGHYQAVALLPMYCWSVPFAVDDTAARGGNKKLRR